MFWNRPDFRGLSDKYLERGSRSGISPISGIEAALQGTTPYDVVGGAISENYRDLTSQRLSRYRYQWKFYSGDHFENPWEDGERKTVNNYCKLVCEKSINFFLAQGWKVKSPEGNEQVAELINEAWSANDRMSLSYRITQFGGVNGDCFVLVTVQTLDREGQELPKDKWTVRLVAFDPRYCFPFFSAGNPNQMDSIMIQFPTTSLDDPSTNILYTVYITPQTMQIWHNDVKIDEQDNPFKRVNVVHFKNSELANSSFGVSDIDDIIPINEEYNIVANSIRRTIKYHGEPTTLIFGARASDMERGAKKVWSNLPGKDARVENLKLDGDLAAAQEYLQHLEDQILKVGEIPKIALVSKEQTAVSNTSGIAIQMLYQPLVEKCNRKRICFTQSVREVNRLILIAERELIGTDIDELADDVDLIDLTEVEYTSPLPRDMTAEINNGVILLENGVWSKAEFARRLGGSEDLERLALELTADQQATLITAYENQRAVMGLRPNTLAAFLGSINLSEELVEIAKQYSALQNKKSKQTPVDKNIPVVESSKPDAALKKPKQRVLTA